MAEQKLITIQRYKKDQHRPSGVAIGTKQQVYEHIFLQEKQTAERIRQAGRKNYKGAFDDWEEVSKLEQAEVVETIEDKLEKLKEAKKPIEEIKAPEFTDLSEESKEEIITEEKPKRTRKKKETTEN